MNVKLTLSYMECDGYFVFLLKRPTRLIFHDRSRPSKQYGVNNDDSEVIPKNK